MTDSESEPLLDQHASLLELRLWKVEELKAWLCEHGLKKSGNKDVLVNRVYKAMDASLDSDNDADVCSFNGAHSFDNAVANNEIVPIHLVSKPWTQIAFNDIPDISVKDVDSYFLYHKNPTTGGLLNYDRQMKKAKRFSNEAFIKDIEFNCVKDGCKYCYFKCNCLPSMRQTVQVGNLGKTSTCYSLNVCIQKTSALVIKAECNCKAGASGLCAHVGGLLYHLAKMRGACTSNECTWDRPRPMQRKPSPKRVCDINFYKTDKDKPIASKVKPFPGVYQAGPCNDSDIFLQQLFVNCNECGTGLLEIKCPYGSDNSDEPWRHKLPLECGLDSKFFCKEGDGKLVLKENHNYMFQIQGQLAVYELDWVDFVVWTKKGLSVQRIRFSIEKWNDMLPKLKDFYLKGIAPELFSERIKRGKSLY